MVKWKKDAFTIYYAPNRNKLPVTRTGYTCGTFQVIRYAHQLWGCSHAPSLTFIGITSDHSAPCKKAAEYLLSTGINWNYPSISQVLEGNFLTYDEFRALIRKAVLSNDDGMVVTRTFEGDSKITAELHSKASGTIKKETYEDTEFADAMKEQLAEFSKPISERLAARLEIPPT